MTKELFLHVGMHKTATTTLQLDVFPHLKGVSYLGRPYNVRQDVLTNHFVDLFDDSTEDKVLVSNETLSGPMLPFFQRKYEQLAWSELQAQSLSSLGRRVPRAKVIICFREPAAMIKSLYRHYVKAGGRMSLSEFVSLDGDSLFHFRDFLYSGRLSSIDDSFESQPFVIDFDDLVGDTSRVLAGLCNYMGIPPIDETEYEVTRANSGLKGRQLRVMRSLNRLDSGNIVREGMGLRLTNRLSVFAKVDPWGISRLLPSGSAQLMPIEMEKQIESVVKDDWKYIKSRTTY